MFFISLYLLLSPFVFLYLHFTPFNSLSYIITFDNR